MHFDTWAVVFATVLGPVFAVEAQRQISAWKERQNRKLWIFRVLMNTRANILAAEAVNAFNAIPIEFYGDEDVMDPWRTYFDHLETKGMDQKLWLDKRWDLYCNLLLALSKHLRYSFDLVTIKKKIYAPEGHGKLQTDQELIRQAVVALLSGKFALPLDVQKLPQDAEMTQRITAVQNALLDWLSGKVTPSVKIERESEPQGPLSALDQLRR